MLNENTQCGVMCDLGLYDIKINKLIRNKILMLIADYSEAMEKWRTGRI